MIYWICIEFHCLFSLSSTWCDRSVARLYSLHCKYFLWIQLNIKNLDFGQRKMILSSFQEQMLVDILFSPSSFISPLIWHFSGYQSNTWIAFRTFTTLWWQTTTTIITSTITPAPTTTHRKLLGHVNCFESLLIAFILILQMEWCWCSRPIKVRKKKKLKFISGRVAWVEMRLDLVFCVSFHVSALTTFSHQFNLYVCFIAAFVLLFFLIRFCASSFWLVHALLSISPRSALLHYIIFCLSLCPLMLINK